MRLIKYASALLDRDKYVNIRRIVNIERHDPYSKYLRAYTRARQGQRARRMREGLPSVHWCPRLFRN